MEQYDRRHREPDGIDLIARAAGESTDLDAVSAAASAIITQVLVIILMIAGIFLMVYVWTLADRVETLERNMEIIVTDFIEYD